MYSRQEAAQLKKEFWTAFGQYMQPVRSAEGERVSWVNYKTGEKNVSFRLHADNKMATVAIELTHPDAGVQELYFEQLRQVKNLLEEAVGEAWTWQLHATDEWSKTVSRIYTERAGVSILRREDWPALISFFKPRMVALDEFWSRVKYAFEGLR